MKWKPLIENSEIMKKSHKRSRRENLRFYGIPETEEEESTEAFLKAFLEKELNVENAQYILSSKEFIASAKRIETQENPGSS